MGAPPIGGRRLVGWDVHRVVFRKIFEGSKARAEARETEARQRLWAVGDIHGCVDLLHRLIWGVEALRTSDEPIDIVFLGDYVDRGPDSRGVIETLIALAARHDVRARFVRGNHDHLMREFLDRADLGPVWYGMGGEATLRSYGVSPPVHLASPAAWAEVQAEFRANVPEAHVQFLDALEPSVQTDKYFLTHAGVYPGRSLARQKPKDLMWIRGIFLESARASEKVVVHGHTPADLPHSDFRRIGVDTGAYASGILTGVLLVDDDRHFVQARRIGDEIQVIDGVVPTGG